MSLKIKAVSLAVMISMCSVDGFAAAPVYNSTSSSTSSTTSSISLDDGCNQLSQSAIRRGLLGRVINLLPQDSKDNVQQFLKDSNVYQINNMSSNITPIKFSNLTLATSSLWGTVVNLAKQIVNNLINSAINAVDNALTSIYERAIDLTVGKAMQAYNGAVDRLSSKIGGYGEPFVNTLFRNAPAGVLSAASQCAKDLTADCLTNVSNQFDMLLDENRIQTATYRTWRKFDLDLSEAREKLLNKYASKYGTSNSMMSKVYSNLIQETRNASRQLQNSALYESYNYVNDIISDANNSMVNTVRTYGN